MTGVLVASDLDRTLIYSAAAFSPAAAGADAPAAGDDAAAVAQPLVVVERYADRDASFVTTGAARALGELPRYATVVPVTTRTVAQLARVTLPGPPAAYAVAANGGVLVADGSADRAWSDTVRRKLAASAPLQSVLAHLDTQCRPEWTTALRTADDLFCYAVVDRAKLPVTFLAELTEWAAARGWRTSLQGRKLYCVPDQLTKAAAVEEISVRVGATVVLAAGDSLLDIDLLTAADQGVRPSHGELHATGWRAEHVQVIDAVGLVAGEQIAIWLLDRARTLSASSASPLRQAKTPSGT